MKKEDAEWLLTLLDEDLISEAGHMEERYACHPRAAVHSKWSRKIVAAAVAAIVLTGSALGTAGVTKYYQRMQSVSKQEKGQMLEGVDHSRADAESYSRPLSEKEQKRYEELVKAYEAGQFPEGQLCTVQTAQEIGQNRQKIWYCYEQGMYYIPDTELTDEQLLQIIDFREKMDYTLTERSKKIQSEQKQVKGKMTEEACAAEAKKCLEQFLDLKTEQMTYSIQREKIENWHGQKQGVNIEITCESTDWKYAYTVSLDDHTGEWYDIEIKDWWDRKEAEENILYNMKEEAYLTLGRTYRKKLESIYGKNSIQKMTVEYTSKGKKKRNNILYFAQLNEKRLLEIAYCTKLDTVYSIAITNMHDRTEFDKLFKKSMKEQGIKVKKRQIP